MESNLKIAFNNYFNDILKKSLKYSEIFTVSVDLYNKSITLISNIPSQLIQILKYDKDLFDKLKEELHFSFKKNNPDIETFEIILEDDFTIKIKYNFNIKSVKDLGIYLEIAENLSFEDIINLCKSNPLFNRLCESELLWINLFRRKFPDIPEELKGNNINYKELYKNITEYQKIISGKINYKIKLNNSRDSVKYLTGKEKIIGKEVQYREDLNIRRMYGKYMNSFDDFSLNYLIYTNLFNPYETPLLYSKYFLNEEMIIKILEINGTRPIYSMTVFIFDELFSPDRIKNFSELLNMLRLILLHEDKLLTSLICSSFKTILRIYSPLGLDPFNRILKIFEISGIGNFIENYINQKQPLTHFTILNFLTECRNSLQ